jgi:sporulation protein YlmC with PRC-barrel domain
MRLSDLLGCDVVTESGWPLGKARDLRVETSERTAKVTGLVLTPPGSSGSILRWRSTDGHTTQHEVVPWDAVQSIEEGRIVVKEGTTVSRPSRAGTPSP